MAWRPHFAYPTPAGFVDEPAWYPFDARQSYGFSATVLQLLGQVLVLDADAPFLWRAIYWDDGDFGNSLVGQVAYRIRDPYGDYLSDNFIPALMWQGAYTAQPWVNQVESSVVPIGPYYTAPYSGGMAAPLVEEILCPGGSTLTMDLIWLGTPPVNDLASNSNRFMAIGVKRRPLSECGKEYRS